ncbi:hypothetical protein P4B35_10850 [Pontiellaceae bacterium B12227]|nr:hypothetical protein [Pontiellaceae bacterium B12227]
MLSFIFLLKMSDPTGYEDAYLPRIGLTTNAVGRAILCNTETGEEFFPIGFSHTNSAQDEDYLGSKHSLFTPEFYDTNRWEEVLTDMERFGYNSIRVFFSNDVASTNMAGVVMPTGFGGRADNSVSGVDPVYMDNFIDFMARAGRHGIYVVPVLNNTPPTAYYYAIRDQYAFNPDYAERNIVWGTEAQLQTRMEGWRCILGYIKEKDEGLLSNILCNLMCGEVRAQANYQPFTKTTGFVDGPNGQSYDMSSDADRQGLFNDGVVYWADQVGQAIKSVDPDALTGVTVGLYQGDIGQSPGLYTTNGIRMASDYYNNHPALAAPLFNSGAPGLDLVDVHVYPWRDVGAEGRLLASMIDDCQLDTVTDKALVAFEFGAQRNDPDYYPASSCYLGVSPSLVSIDMHEQRQLLLDRGFRSVLFFAYENLGFDEDVITAIEPYKQIYSKLSPSLLDWPLEEPDFSDTFSDGDSAGWTLSGGGDWTVLTGDEALYQGDTAAARFGTIDGLVVTNFSMETDIILRANQNWAGVQFRKTNPGDGPFDSGYTVFIHRGGEVRLFDASTLTTEAAVMMPFRPLDTQITLKVTVVGDTISIYVNNRKMTDVVRTSYASGYCGVVSFKTRAVFDEVHIQKLP